MPTFKPQLDDIRLILEALDARGLTQEIPAYKAADPETIAMLMESVADFSKEVAFPLNQSGDQEGCTYDPKDFSVKTPKGFKAAFDTFREMGLIGLAGDENYGGTGLPHYLEAALHELVISANFSLATYPGLTSGATKVLEKYATDELKQKFLPLMYAGKCGGTMCLTEPQAGSDLGLVRTKAEPQDDGSFSITGDKIFITCGEHDLTENICHLVLARLPGAPAGTRGITLFLVPKFLPDTNGRNGVKCTGIEHKMGIHASSTCSMNFDGAKGWMIGQPNEGMKAMFTMMNDARLNVGIQGLGLSEVAYQTAAEYTNTRVQGKHISQANNAEAKAVPVINHANVRRDLMDMKCQIDGYRALVYDIAMALDLAEKHPEPTVRKNADEYASLITPIIKACISDLSLWTAQKSIQLHGGMGFITETGIEQYYRDSLIGTIYEGTNDIQSMDFTFRKVLEPKNLGYRLGLFMNPLLLELQEARKNPDALSQVKALEKAMEMFRNAGNGLLQAGMTGKLDDVLVHSRDFMDMFGKLAVGRMWLKIMTAARDHLAADAPGPQTAFYKTKLELGEYYMQRIMLPEMKRLEMRIEAGAMTIPQTPPAQLLPGDELGIGKETPAPANDGKNKGLRFGM